MELRASAKESRSGSILMTTSNWTPADTDQAKKFWAEYQACHDISARLGQAVGIDPKTGRVWFGKSSLDIVLQLRAAGEQTPLYFLRVGRDYYGRKGGRR
jgi:hypothetical protein